MPSVANFYRKRDGVTHLGPIASAGANQATAFQMVSPRSQGSGLAQTQDVLGEITGNAFVNLPTGPGVAVGDLYILYTKAFTPTVNSAVADSLIGGAQVYVANINHSFRCVENNAGVFVWMVEK